MAAQAKFQITRVAQRVAEVGAGRGDRVFQQRQQLVDGQLLAEQPRHMTQE